MSGQAGPGQPMGGRVMSTGTYRDEAPQTSRRATCTGTIRRDSEHGIEPARVVPVADGQATVSGHALAVPSGFSVEKKRSY